MVRVNVNILNTNELKYLRRCLSCIRSQTFTSFHVTVIDNASVDGSVEWLQSECSDVRLIRNAQNMFYCTGHNIGLKATSCEYVLLLNADVFLAPDFLAEMVIALDADKKLRGVQGKLWKMFDVADDPETMKEKWIDTTGIVMTQSRRNFDRFQETNDQGNYDEPGSVFGPDGSAPLYRRAMLEDIAIMDEVFDDDFLIYREVVDLSWRARAKGWEFVYVPTAHAYHLRGFSPRTRKKQPLFFKKLSFRNRYLTLIKNETWASIRPHLMRFIGFELAMLMHVLLREPALISAWFDLFALIPKALKKRKIIQSTRQISNELITKDFQKKAPRLHH